MASPPPSWYPLKADASAADSAEGSEPSFALTLSNAFALLRALYEEVGIVIVPSGRAKPTPPQEPEGPAKRPKKQMRILETSDIFLESQQHIPSGLMTLLQSVRIPTPKGFKDVSRGEVEEFLGDAFLTTLEGPAFTARFTYRELDAMRFAFVAVAKHILVRGLLDPEGRLTPLAKRDLKANCKAGDESEGGRGAVGTGMGPGPPAAAARPQRHVKAMLLEECARRWPHTPPAKAAVISIVSDPEQPRHRPLFQATLELTLAKHHKFTGQWCRCKMDAENDVCSDALTFLHSSAPP